MALDRAAVDRAATFRRLSPSGIERAGALLGRDFQDVSLFALLVADPVRRAHVVPPLLGSLVRDGVRYGVAEATVGEHAGVAVWLAPGRMAMTPGRMLRTGALTAPVWLG